MKKLLNRIWDFLEPKCEVCGSHKMPLFMKHYGKGKVIICQNCDKNNQEKQCQKIYIVKLMMIGMLKNG